MKNFEERYLELVNDIIMLGARRQTRNGETMSVWAPSLHIDSLIYDKFPVITTRKMFHKGVQGEFATFLQGANNVEDFRGNGCNFWDTWADDDGYLNLDYGNGWKEQFAHVFKAIEEGGTDRRMLVNTWDYKRLPDLSLPCCHYSYQFGVYNGQVNLLWNQRSVDVMVGLPSDIILAALMLIGVAVETGLKPGVITMQFGDAHIYNVHEDQAIDQLQRDVLEHPTYQYWNQDGFFNFKKGDLILKDYEAHDKIHYALLG